MKLPFWFTQKKTINLKKLAESWSGFAAAFGICLVQIIVLVIIFPREVHDLLPFSLAVLFGTLRGLTEHKNAPVWFGLNWGLGLAAVFFGTHMFSPECLYHGELWHYLIVPATITSYFVARRFAESMGVCDDCYGTLWSPPKKQNSSRELNSPNPYFANSSNTASAPKDSTPTPPPLKRPKIAKDGISGDYKPIAPLYLAHTPYMVSVDKINIARNSPPVESLEDQAFRIRRKKREEALMRGRTE